MNGRRIGKRRKKKKNRRGGGGNAFMNTPDVGQVGGSGGMDDDDAAGGGGGVDSSAIDEDSLMGDDAEISIFGQTAGASNATWVECDRCKKVRRRLTIIYCVTFLAEIAYLIIILSTPLHLPLSHSGDAYAEWLMHANSLPSGTAP